MRLCTHQNIKYYKNKESQPLKYFLCLLLLALPTLASAKDSCVVLGFNIGQTQVDVTKNFEGESETFEAAGTGLSIGYLFNPQFITQLGATVSENYSLFGTFDRISHIQLDALVGYQIHWKKLRLTPKIGFAQWELDSREGRLFNPGSEERTKQSGSDFFWAASLGYAVTRNVELSLSHKNVKTGFGGYQLSHIELLLGL